MCSQIIFDIDVSNVKIMYKFYNVDEFQKIYLIKFQDDIEK